MRYGVWVLASTALLFLFTACSDDVWDWKPSPAPTEWVFSWPPKPAEYEGCKLELFKDNATSAEVVHLRLKGTDAEMAYAHGYLLAPYIVHVVDNVLIAMTGGPSSYTSVHDSITEDWDWGPAYGDELGRMLSGVKDRAAASGQGEGWDTNLTSLGRPLDVGDLMVLNVFIDELAPWGEVFAAWGSMSVGRDLYLGRNYYVDDADPGVELARAWMVVTYESGSRKYMTMGMPGYIGVTTGINADGVVVAPSVSQDGPAASGRGKPLGLILREHLLHASPQSAPDDELLNRLKTSMKYGTWNVLGAAPKALPAEWPKEGYVVETDGDGSTKRFSRDPGVWPSGLDNAIFVGDTHRVGKGGTYSGDDQLYYDLVMTWSAKFIANEFMGDSNAKQVLRDYATGTSPGNVYSVVFRAVRGDVRVFVAVSDGVQPAGTRPFAKMDPSQLW